MFKETDQGVLLSIKAKPNARKNEIRGVQNDRLVIAITAIAEKGRANAAIVKLLSKKTGIAKSRFLLIAGETNALKTLLVQSAAIADLQCLLPT
jgi:uncharacterized protein (TIGR00251 family)